MEIEKILEARDKEIEKVLNDEECIEKRTQKWIEHEAAIYLQSELNKYDGILDASGIKTKDGGISYDGIVEMMKDGSSKAKDLLGRIDVQVKGRLVDKIPTGNSKFRIEIKHLENYAKNILGVLLFVVYIEKETREKKIFYRNLLPVDLKQIFYKIDENDDKEKKISVDVYPIDSNKKTELKKVCANFLKAQKQQVNKRIILLNPDTPIIEGWIQDMRNDKEEYLKDKTYLYVKVHEDEGFIPAILGENGKISEIEIINKDIELDGIKYYDSCKIVTTEEERYAIIDDTITLKEKSIHFSFKGNIDKKIKDMQFAIRFLNKYTINNEKNIEKLQVAVNILTEFNEILQKFGIKIKENLNALTNEDYRHINYFFSIMKNEKEVVKRFLQPSVYSLKLCGKELLFIINLADKNKQKLLVQNFFDEKLEGRIVLGYNGQFYKITPYIWLKDIHIENLLNYNKDIVETSIINCIPNKITSEKLNLLLLSYISAYDRTKNEDFYRIALIIANKLVSFDKTNHIYMINKLQLLKRKRNLTEDEKIILQKYKEEDITNVELYCISKILDNKSDIEYYYNSKLSDEERKEINKYPIMNL